MWRFDCREAECSAECEKEVVHYGKFVGGAVGGGEARAAEKIQCMSFGMCRKVNVLMSMY